MTFHPDTLPNLRGKVFIVTGGNSGIGYHTVAHLAKHGAHVYMGVRSPEKGAAAVASIKNMHPSVDANIDLLEIDLMDLGSVVAAANRFQSLETALHGLVNNAGIMATPFQVTKDGHEAQWQTNYLAHWVLTTHLLPLMLRTAARTPELPGSVRIVNVSSSGHLMAAKGGGINFQNPSLRDEDEGGVLRADQGPWARYGQSKLANILHARTLHTTYGPGSSRSARGDGGGEIWVSSVHPGLVETNLTGSMSSRMVGGALSVARLLGLLYTADKGSWTSVFCAASPDMKAQESGMYFEIFHRFGEPRWQSKEAKDEKLAERLEAWTRDMMMKEGWVQ